MIKLPDAKETKIVNQVGNGAFEWGYESGWNAAIAEVQRLNATAQPVSDGCKVPEGWKLVPIEPSWEMLSADGCKEHHNGQKCLHHDNRRRIWTAMLAAAPGGQDD